MAKRKPKIENQMFLLKLLDTEYLKRRRFLFIKLSVVINRQGVLGIKFNSQIASKANE